MYICWIINCFNRHGCTVQILKIKWSVFITQAAGAYSAVRCLFKYKSIILVLKDLRLKCNCHCTMSSINVLESYH